MKFIFPKNYRYKAKIFGFMDYITAIIDLFIGIALFFLLKLFVRKIATGIYLFIILYLPWILFSIFITGGENIITYIIMMIQFLKRRGVYFYNKKY